MSENGDTTKPRKRKPRQAVAVSEPHDGVDLSEQSAEAVTNIISNDPARPGSPRRAFWVEAP